MIELIDHNGFRVNSMRDIPTNTVPTITTVNHYLPYNTHNYYDITFDDRTVRTVLASHPSFVDSWLSDNALPLRYPMVGLDVEWRPNTQRNIQNPVATLQLCIGNRCLVFQILHSPSIPSSLVSFLANPNVVFFGVGIQQDAEKLRENYNLVVENLCDLRYLAAEKLSDPELNQAGLMSLSFRVLNYEVSKPEGIRRSRWDNRWLSDQQVQYATVDAYLSYQIGYRLTSYRYR